MSSEPRTKAGQELWEDYRGWRSTGHPVGLGTPEHFGRRIAAIEAEAAVAPSEPPRPDLQQQVADDLLRRREAGVREYGVPLQPHNGRDALVDAYEEALDLSCYLKQAIVERSASSGQLINRCCPLDIGHDGPHAWIPENEAAPSGLSAGADAAEWHRYLHNEGILLDDDGDECGPWHHRVFLGASSGLPPLDVERLAAAINDAQIDPDELRIGKDLRPVAARILARLSEGSGTTEPERPTRTIVYDAEGGYAEFDRALTQDEVDSLRRPDQQPGANQDAGGMPRAPDGGWK